MSIERTSNVLVRHVTPSQGGAPIPPDVLHPIRSEYVEVNWLPVIGPTATLLARRLDQFAGGWVEGEPA